MSRNIRYTAWSRPHRKMWGMPVVKSGDWMALRDGRSVYIKTLWDAGPYAYIPQMAGDEVVPTEPSTNVVVDTASAVVDTAAAVATTALDVFKRYWPAVIVSGIIGFGFGRRG